MTAATKLMGHAIELGSQNVTKYRFLHVWWTKIPKVYNLANNKYFSTLRKTSSHKINVNMTSSEDMEAILTLSALAINGRKRRLLLSSLLGFKFSFFFQFQYSVSPSFRNMHHFMLLITNQPELHSANFVSWPTWHVCHRKFAPVHGSYENC